MRLVAKSSLTARSNFLPPSNVDTMVAAARVVKSVNVSAYLDALVSLADLALATLLVHRSGWGSGQTMADEGRRGLTVVS